MATLEDSGEPAPATHKKDDPASSEIVAEILLALRGLRYGSVEITVHDSRVVQIEKKEKVRLQRKSIGEMR